MNDDFFEKYGLEVSEGQVEVGKTYPIYGMVTEILDFNQQEPVKCVVNFNILVSMSGITSDKLLILKERAFDPGIFITQISKFNQDADNKKIFTYEGICNTAIFGRKQELGVQ